MAQGKAVHEIWKEWKRTYMRKSGKWRKRKRERLAVFQSFWTGGGSRWPSLSSSTWSTMRTDTACRQFLGWAPSYSQAVILEAPHCIALHDPCVRWAPKDALKGPRLTTTCGPRRIEWSLLSPTWQDAQDELCGDRRCDTFEMGFIPTAFIIFYFAVIENYFFCPSRKHFRAPPSSGIWATDTLVRSLWLPASQSGERKSLPKASLVSSLSLGPGSLWPPASCPTTGASSLWEQCMP